MAEPIVIIRDGSSVRIEVGLKPDGGEDLGQPTYEKKGDRHVIKWPKGKLSRKGTDLPQRRKPDGWDIGPEERVVEPK